MPISYQVAAGTRLRRPFRARGGATPAGAAYVVSPLIYPLILGPRLGKGVPTRIMFARLIGYAVLAYFAVRRVVAVL